MAVEIDKGRVEKQAREILDKFAKALERIEGGHESDGYVDRDEFERDESVSSSSSDNGFKQKMLNNAPEHDEDFIIAESKEWK